MKSENALLTCIDQCMPSVIDLVKDIGAHPELGFQEFRTSALVNDFLRQAGYDAETKLAITGIKAKLKNDAHQPNIAVIGELDGIICPESNRADPLTGATHHCGHNLQLGVMMAVAHAFKISGIASELGGNVTFIAAPAEEFIDLEFRTSIRQRGDIHFFGGKQELVRCGVFDDIDAAMMVHSQSNMPDPFVGLVETGNGFIAERVNYIGKTAHAAAAPEDGINALHAAVLGINAVNAMRETLREDQHNRVHYIITKGGDVVNSIPADVRLECFVRSNSIDSIRQLLEKANRAFTSGGDAVGARTEIRSLPGYLPLTCNTKLNEFFKTNAERFIPSSHVRPIAHFTASTDMGDISHLMPAIHPLTGGVKGALHAADFDVVDYHAAVTIPAKVMALTLLDLLKDEAAGIKSILKESKPLLSKQEYLTLMNSLSNH